MRLVVKWIRRGTEACLLKRMEPPRHRAHSPPARAGTPRGRAPASRATHRWRSSLRADAARPSDRTHRRSRDRRTASANAYEKPTAGTPGTACRSRARANAPTERTEQMSSTNNLVARAAGGPRVRRPLQRADVRTEPARTRLHVRGRGETERCRTPLVLQPERPLLGLRPDPRRPGNPHLAAWPPPPLGRGQGRPHLVDDRAPPGLAPLRLLPAHAGMAPSTPPF